MCDAAVCEGGLLGRVNPAAPMLPTHLSADPSHDPLFAVHGAPQVRPVTGGLVGLGAKMVCRPASKPCTHAHHGLARC